jgi:hypothetical protein
MPTVKLSPLKEQQERDKNVSSLACKNLFDESSPTEKGCAGQPSPSEKCDAVESPPCASEWAKQAQPAHEELQYLNLVRWDIFYPGSWIPDPTFLLPVLCSFHDKFSDLFVSFEVIEFKVPVPVLHLVCFLSSLILSFLKELHYLAIRFT